ncbi:response regulator transcription factor [Acinetobacter sp. YH12045]|uniref:response regulator transcription factor n=1 Tax=Acinetobacter sp. YH12045 TaxID=2601051 RepID=UPI0015D330B4|nr:response regulator transcription factor [Acinetobacter sp. YH12045]
MNFEPPLLKPMLVLEDDPIHQLRIFNILESFGYEKNDILFSQTIEFAKNICVSKPVKFMMVDLNLPDGSGIDFIQNIRQKNESNIPIMVLSSWNTLEVIYNALNVGATGYVLKEKDDFELMFAIRTMLKGEAIIDPTIAKKILTKFGHLLHEKSQDYCKEHAEMSQRQIEILNCVANGMTSREIGDELNISKYTVGVHIKNIYQKLEVNSRTKAINAAKKMGII